MVILEIRVEFWVRKEKDRLVKYLRDSNRDIWWSAALLQHPVNYPIMHHGGVSYLTRFMTQTALRFMFYHQATETHCNSSADALVDNFRSQFFSLFLSLYQRQITTCHQRCFPQLFFHTVSLRSPQNDSALSGDLWGMRQSGADLSFTPTCGTKRRFPMKSTLGR